MTVKTEWYIGSCRAYTAPQNGFTGVVDRVEIRVRAFDDAKPNGPVGDVYQEVILPLPAAGDKNFVAPGDVTEADIVGWVKDLLTSQVRPVTLHDESEDAPQTNNAAALEAQALARYTELATPVSVPFTPKAS